MNNNICLIFGAGDYYEPPPDISSDSFIIAADGGYDILKRFGIVPGLVVGDFDSCWLPPADINIVALPQEKDITDMKAALELGLEKGFRIFHIYGGTGGRFDHTMANIQCLAMLADKGATGYLFDKDIVITAIKNDSIHFGALAQGYVSVFAHSDVAEGVYEFGLKYSLENATLHNTCPLGVSNEFTGSPSSISVYKGTLIIVYPKCGFDLPHL